MKLNKYKENLLFVPLGGANEIGMNLNMYHYNGKWIVVDCGIGFADDYLPGADLILPDISFLVEQKDNILGYVITHAHEDHVGAIPHIWEYAKAPIYTTKFTAEFLKTKLDETSFKNEVKINEIKGNKPFKLGDFSIEAINITHSIPEMHGLAITTPKGVVMHTGDWKFDPEPTEGQATDEETLAAYGDKGVLALVCDSTNVFSPGSSISEAVVKKNLTEIIAKQKERVVVTTFASNISRIRTIIDAAKKTNRKIVVAGRSLWRIIDVAKASGYLQDVPELYSEREMGSIAKNKTLLLCTGCQGEPMAAMSRVAEKTHPRIKLTPKDTVIFSSKIIPGNEKGIFRMLNLLCQQGINIVTEKEAQIHTSGHPYRDELTKMYDLTKPQISIPVHGEARHIKEHAELAADIGVPMQVRMTNGDVLLLEDNKCDKIGVVESGVFAIDARGTMFHSPDGDVMFQRRKQQRSGAVFISAALNKKGDIIGEPKITAPGLLDRNEHVDFLEFLQEEAEIAMEGRKSVEDAIKTTRKVIKKLIFKKLDKNPVVEIQIHKV